MRLPFPAPPVIAPVAASGRICQGPPQAVYFTLDIFALMWYSSSQEEQETAFRSGGLRGRARFARQTDSPQRLARKAHFLFFADKKEKKDKKQVKNSVITYLC